MWASCNYGIFVPSHTCTHGQSTKNSRLFRLNHEFTKSLSTVQTIPEESPEHRSNCQQDPSDVGEFRGRSRSAAVTQAPQDLLTVPTETKTLSLNPQGAAIREESSVSLFSLGKCSEMMDDEEFDLEDNSYEMLDIEYEVEGDDLLYFGGSEMILNGNSTANPATSVNESECDGATDDEVDVRTSSIRFPVSNSAQLHVFHARLEHLILNVPDFPPARTFVE